LNVASIQEDGRGHRPRHQQPNGFTEKLIEPGDMRFLMIDPLAKHGENKKNTARSNSASTEQYKIPCPRELINLNKRSTTITPVRTSTPTKPIGRTPKVTKINLDMEKPAVPQLRLAWPMFPAVSAIK
jgi:hypothetical protein